MAKHLYRGLELTREFHRHLVSKTFRRHPFAQRGY